MKLTTFLSLVLVLLALFSTMDVHAGLIRVETDPTTETDSLTVADAQKRLAELQRLKAEVEAELKHLQRLQHLKTQILEDLNRLEELQQLKIKMVKELKPDVVVTDAKKKLFRTVTTNADSVIIPVKDPNLRFDGSYDRSGFVRTGTDYALLFATDAYEHWDDLLTPIKDAEAIGAELADRYGFQVEIKKNLKSRVDIRTVIQAYAEKDYQTGDQLLVYFAGHGNFMESNQMGYIAASNSELPEDDPAHNTYLSYGTLREDLDAMACDRIMLVLDVDYGGTFDDNTILRGTPKTRGLRAVPRLDLADTLKVKTRWSLSAGGKESIYDGELIGHSLFTLALLRTLKGETLKGEGNTLRDGVLTLPEIERQLPRHIQMELANLSKLYGGMELKQTPTSRSFGSGETAAKAFVFIEKDFVAPPQTR